MANLPLRPDSVRANPTLQTLSRSALLREIVRACDRHGIAPTRFGVDAARDPRLVFDIRRGRSPFPKVQAKVLGYIAQLDREARHAA